MVLNVLNESHLADVRPHAHAKLKEPLGQIAVVPFDCPSGRGRVTLTFSAMGPEFIS